MGFRPCKRKGNGVGTMGGLGAQLSRASGTASSICPHHRSTRRTSSSKERKGKWSITERAVDPGRRGFKPGHAMAWLCGPRQVSSTLTHQMGRDQCLLRAVVRLTHTFTCKVRVVSAHPGWVFTLWVGEDVPGQEGWAGWRPDSDPGPCTPFSTSAFPTMRQSPPGTGLE